MSGESLYVCVLRLNREDSGEWGEVFRNIYLCVHCLCVEERCSTSTDERKEERIAPPSATTLSPLMRVKSIKSK